MLTDNNILNIIIGVLIAIISFKSAKSIYYDYIFEGKVLKWNEWDAGSLSYFLSGVAGCVWGIITALISIFRLF